MKDAKKSGAPTRRGGSSMLLEFHCDDDRANYSFDVLNEK